MFILTQIHVVNRKTNISFWLVAFLVLVILFSGSLNSWTLSFYFVCVLLPVIIGTSLYFNEVLVPRFLLTDRYQLFTLRFFYLLVVSIYAELLVMMLAFVLLADYSIENLGDYAGDIRLLALIMYLIVFGYSFIGAFSRLKRRELEIERLTKKESNQEATLLLTINRKKVPLNVADIQLVESLSDYIKIHLENSTLITRERISKMEEELPENFIRIHRSFLVNKKYVVSYTSEKVAVAGLELTIGRKYKQAALSELSAS